MSSIEVVVPTCPVPPAPPWPAATCPRARKPAGGFLKRPLAIFTLAWWGHRQGQLALEDLRAWLGVQELVERRCQIAPDTPVHYTVDELQRLLQAPRQAPVERAVAHLEAVGLLTWTPSALHLLPHPERLEAYDPAGLAALRAALPPVPWVPVPRRLNVWLARAGQPGLIATALGVLTRCLRYADHQCIAGGRVAAGWVARVFGVAERTVQRSLQALEACGWLARRPEGPAQERRHGRYTTLNLQWERPGMTVKPARQEDQGTPDTPGAARPGQAPPGHGLSPLPAAPCPDLSPFLGEDSPVTYDEPEGYAGHPATPPAPQPFQESKRQRPEPASCRPAGAWPPPQGIHPPPAAMPPAISLDEATVTATEVAAATASLVAQGLNPTFLIRPTVLAEVQRLRQAACASPLSPPVSETPAPSVQTCAPPPLEAGLRDVVSPVPSPPAPCATPAASAVPPHPPSPRPPVFPAPCPPPRPPSLADVIPLDLRDVGRLLELHRQAIARGWLRGSEAERLHVVAAAVHALRVGDEPCKLFVWLLQHQAWEMITQDDEDQARQRLRVHDWGPCRRATPPSVAPAIPALSDEARLVQQAEQVVRQAGWRGEPFLAVKLHDATWTRARWEAAQAELARWQAGQARQHRGLQALGEDAAAAWAPENLDDDVLQDD